jgi:hypothetical protein
MKHIFLGSLAALITMGITVSLHFYGVHDLQGATAMIAGYPGLLANINRVRINEMLFTGVNWLFYFLILEGIAALRRRLSS